MSDTIQFRVLDFDCPTCASNVERALTRTEGVERVEVHYTTGRVEVDVDGSAADADDVAQTIERHGYSAQRA